MTTLGPYELRSELGRGAMAVVWRAFDPAIGREVAIKEPKIDDSLAPGTRDELASRFIREGKTAGQLNHPGIVTIYNADIIDGRAIIVMELIEGETLADLLARGGISAAAAIGITEQLLDALAYAHSRGVVHRDIKPDNVFVTDDGRVKLTDFGIAHTVTGTALTQAGTVMGTPGYMAPEQVRGEAVDARADLFAVGVMLHEMLTGTNPFMAGDAHPTTIMYRVLNEALPDVRTSLPDAPESLAATVAVATAKDAGQRFSSADEMRGALRGETAIRMPKPTRSGSGRRRYALLAVAALVMVGIGGWILGPSRVGSGFSDGPTVSPSTPTAADSASPESVDAASTDEGIGEHALVFFRDTDLFITDDAGGQAANITSGRGEYMDWTEYKGGLWSPYYDSPTGRIYFVGSSEWWAWMWARETDGAVNRVWANGNPDVDEWPPDETMLWSVSGFADGSACAVSSGGEVYRIGDDGAPSEVILRLDVENCLDAEWSPDGTKVAYADDGEYGDSTMSYVYIAAADGSGPVHADSSRGVGPFNNLKGPVSWSPDSQFLAVISAERDAVIMLDATGEPVRTLYSVQGGGSIGSVSWSPRGDSIAFSIDKTVWVIGADGTNPRQVAIGRHPLWVPASILDALGGGS